MDIVRHKILGVVAGAAVIFGLSAAVYLLVSSAFISCPVSHGWVNLVESMRCHDQKLSSCQLSTVFAVGGLAIAKLIRAFS